MPANIVNPDARESVDAPAAPAPDPGEVLLQMASGKWLTHVLAAAADLGLADRLAAGPRDVDDLAREIGADAGNLHRLLRALASLGIFRETEPRRFAITPLGDALRSDVPHSMRALCLMIASPYMNRAWERLAWAVRTGRDPFEDLFGTDLFGYYEKNPGDGRIFDEAMTGHVTGQAHGVVAAYDFAPFGLVVDVGGGRGTLLATILRANPRAQGILFDLPHVAEAARGALREAGLAGRAQAVGGSFFEKVPEGGNAYVLSFVIHDWGDGKAAEILGNVHAAMREGATLLLVEYVVPPGNDPHFSKLLDLEMLVSGGKGRERTEEEYRALLAGAGFEVTRIVPTPTGASVIEARRQA